MVKAKHITDVAEQYRRDNPECIGGVVLIWQGQEYGWKNELRDPQSERPGAYAVDDKGNAWQAVGGNDYDGAKRWEAVQ